MKIVPRNQSTVDRVLGVVLGVGLVSLVFAGPRTPLGWLGAIFVVTGAIGSWPLYRVFGFSTCPMSS